MKLLYIFLILVGCQSQPKKFEQADKPVDYDKFIEEAESKMIFPASFGKGDYTDTYYTALENLTKCSNYSKDIYAKYEDCRKVYDKSAKVIDGHLKEISDLKAELETWRKLKIWFWLIIGVIIIGNLIYIFKDFLWTLIKARLGI
jgi:hypothetical protein